MVVRIQVQREAAPLVRQMAQEAGISVPDICEVAVYNLIAVWQKDRGVGVKPLDASNGLDGGN